LPRGTDHKEKKEFIQAHKLELGCSVCGYNEIPEALEYDHIDRSKKNFKMSKAHWYSWDRIHKEIENCIILCANCHREKTIKEKDYMELDFEEIEDPQLSLL
jgi:5-methylcytosine-specific restriction endonuclease McrA|tara:strand:- start:5295 stop:5600 length:306 start_codon:yes stop_codon:yes gene_type:complete